MTLMLLGLVLFLGAHSTQMIAPGWRAQRVARMGLLPWKALYAVVSIAGFVLIIVGFGQARQAPLLAWSPPLGLQHVNHLLTLAAFILIVAAYVPRNHFKAWLGHPMLAGVALWAFGHLLVTRFQHDLVLFGAFLAWALVDFVISRRRDRRAGVQYPPGTLAGDAIVVVVGVLAWAVFAFWLHLALIGVKPVG
ncbi:NnrU family protein [Dokdonella sp.]|uniref:NnrU family protein n=1 Tax=Dokdonella sp. TaxID=2291710 RepID=UPI0031BBEB80|nr:NnrU family protein [Dokdonella sp.]